MSERKGVIYERETARYMGVADKLIDTALGEKLESVREFWDAIASGSELSPKKEVEKILRNIGVLIKERKTKEVLFITDLINDWNETEIPQRKNHIVSSLRRCILDNTNFMSPEKWQSLISDDMERLTLFRKEALSQEGFAGGGEGIKEATKDVGKSTVSFVVMSTIVGSVLPHLPMMGEIVTLKMPDELSMSGILASAAGAVIMGVAAAILTKKGKTALTQTVKTALPESLEKLDMDRDWGRALSRWHSSFGLPGAEQDMDERRQALVKEVKGTVLNALDFLEVDAEQRKEISKAQAETLIRAAARVRERLIEKAKEKEVDLRELTERAKDGQLATATREWFMEAFKELEALSSMSGLNGLQKKLSGAEAHETVSEGISVSRNNMGHA